MRVKNVRVKKQLVKESDVLGACGTDIFQQVRIKLVFCLIDYF